MEHPQHKLTNLRRAARSVLRDDSHSYDRLVDYEQISAYLSNERTFIAWSCAGLLLIACSVPLARLNHTLNTNPLVNMASMSTTQTIKSTWLGFGFLISGIALIVLACCRYLTVQQQIREDRYRSSGFLGLAFVSITLVLSGLLALYLLDLRDAF